MQVISKHTTVSTLYLPNYSLQQETLIIIIQCLAAVWALKLHIEVYVTTSVHTVIEKRFAWKINTANFRNKHSANYFIQNPLMRK